MQSKVKITGNSSTGNIRTTGTYNYAIGKFIIVTNEIPFYWQLGTVCKHGHLRLPWFELYIDFIFERHFLQ